MEEPSDEYLLSLWKDNRFTGSFSGLRAFKLALKHEKHLDVSTKRLRKVLRKNMTYISHIQNKLRGERRNYHSVHGVFMLCQSDLASFFHKDEETGKVFPYCMVTIDVYSRRLSGILWLLLTSYSLQSTNTYATLLVALLLQLSFFSSYPHEEKDSSRGKTSFNSNI